MRLDHLLSTENVLSAWHGSRGFLPGVSGVLAWKDRCVPVVGAGMGMLLGSLAATALLVGGVGVRVPAMGSCPVVAGWGCVVWRGGLRTGEWTRADRVAALFWGGWLWSACTDVFRPGPRFGGLVVV